ncbi:ComF family protein [Subtercola frigoramans]|uniref:Amidophosphoribosyltransferase n=1 Tax=Subtercola frigoramans TaxID=120298 RepID=A0ABS2L851_9MICO|nr:phosphoribosyltransferase family protein [Subtercola frigoramans]MBM7473257.1 putative amidophosphoribosyltransferase [Subtercola frigoramans]
MTVLRHLTHTFSEALAAALALVLPVACAGCGAPDRSVCRACMTALAGGEGDVVHLSVDEPGSDPLEVWSAVPYHGVVSSLLSGLKESGRTDVVGVLAETLTPALRSAYTQTRARLPPGEPLHLTVAPSSRAAYRKRGYNPVELLAARARKGGTFCKDEAAPLSTTLRVRAVIADQAGLGVAARRDNLQGALGLRRRFSGGTLEGRHFLLVDDVITSGATLLECRRALQAAGASVWGAVTLAHTESRSGLSAVRHVHDG